MINSKIVLASEEPTATEYIYELESERSESSEIMKDRNQIYINTTHSFPIDFTVAGSSITEIYGDKGIVYGYDSSCFPTNGFVWSINSLGYSGENDIYIDAEKTATDQSLCWAAAAANTLYYTGWLTSNTKDEDDIFSSFRNSFVQNGGGNAHYGYEWYLSGTYNAPQSVDQPYSSGGFFSSAVSSSSFYSSNMQCVGSSNIMALCANELKNGNAVTIGYGNYDSTGSRYNGHAITLWGYTYDSNITSESSDYYKGIIYTDSDDNIVASGINPKTAQNVMRIWDMKWDSSTSSYKLLSNILPENMFGYTQIEYYSIISPAFFTTLSYGNLVFSHAATLQSKTVESSYTMNVSSAGLAMDTTVTFGGIQTVLANGTALDTVVSSGGSMIISSGGTARFSSGGYADNIQASSGAILGLTVAPNTYLEGSYGSTPFKVSANSISNYTVHSDCKLDILLSGTANNIDVLAGGRLNVSSGGTVTGINAASGALLGIAVAPSTYVSGSYNNSSFNITSSVSNYAIHSGCSLDVLLSGTANNIDVLAGGGLNVSSGGSTSSTTVSSGGTQSVFANARSLITSVLSGGTMNVSSGGTATLTTVFSGGIATIFSGGSATNIHASSGALLGLTVAPDTYASGSYNSSAFILSSASISNYIVHSGCTLDVLSGGSTNNTTVHSNGIMNVSSGGTATGINAASGALLGLTVAPGTYASGSYGSTTFEVSSASISNYTVHSGCTLDVLSGGVVTGQMEFESGAIVSAAWGGYFAFDISNLSPNNTALMNNLSLIQGTPNYLINVSGTDDYGSYNLAEGAPTGFSESVYLLKSNNFLGTLSVGRTVSNAYKLYSLKETGNTLSLNIAEKPIKSDIDHTGKSDIILFNSSSNQVEYWKNGVTGGSLQLESGTLDSTTSMGIIGGYDMNSDYNADLVASSFVVSGGSTTMRIGYFSGGTVNVNASNFVSIGETEVSSMSFWELKVGNLTGTPDRNSIVFYSSSSYHLGAWKDGQEDWENISNTFGGDWKMLGCGDFNGDGKDSVLMSYLNGQNYWYADLNGSSGSMGIANWSGWEFGAVGDFAGDGKDDIVLYKKNGDAAGTVVLLRDGNLDDWSSIGTLDVRSWEIKGAGDYTGDCMDDLLVRNSSTGQLGCYLSADMNQWKNLATGSGIDANWTVIA